MNSTRSKKLTNRLLSINLSFSVLTFIRAVGPREVDKITAEGSKEFLNHTYEVKGKVSLEMFVKQAFVYFFRS